MTALPASERFWMICRAPRHPGSKTEPKQRYASAQIARDKARDLADSSGEHFLILEATEIIRPGDGPGDLFAGAA